MGAPIPDNASLKGPFKPMRFAATVEDCVVNGMRMKDLVVRDMESGRLEEYRIRHDQPSAVLEASFVPRHLDSPVGDGYIIVPVSRTSAPR